MNTPRQQVQADETALANAASAMNTIHKMSGLPAKTRSQLQAAEAADVKARNAAATWLATNQPTTSGYAQVQADETALANAASAMNTIHKMSGLPAKAKTALQTAEAAAVKARNAASAWLKANPPTPAPTVPGAPTGLVATPGNGEVTLSWTAPPGDGGAAIIAYKVMGSPSGSATTTGTGVTITGLKNGTTYTFSVAAVNSVGTGPPSVSVTATPVAPTPPTPTPAGPPGTWKLIFDDEFDGTSLDTTRWAPHWFEEGGNMNNVGTYAGNVSVADSCAQLKLASASSGALISTNPNGGASPGFQFTYGYAEARVLFPGSGATIDDWPAFWTDGQNWPADGEIDIAEGLGTLTANYHYSGGTIDSGTIPGDWGGEFHTFGVNWQPGRIDWWWDRQIVHSIVEGVTASPQYVIVNIGSGEGPVVEGAVVQVDYVRVWQPA